MIFDIPKLRRYRDLGYNVLMTGHAGVGKTAAIKAVLDGLHWKYFSAPTMDPWVDLIGVPRAVPDDKRGGQVLELVRPEFVKDGKVEAIFIDELNRAPDKVLDALMELIQFGTINGHRLANLKFVWAAINPFDESGDYNVNKLDRALVDRFHAHLEIPYDVDKEYFVGKYPDIGEAFVTWWRGLNDTTKAAISPRRLDFACKAYMDDMPLGDILPAGANISQLKQGIKALPFAEQMAAIKSAAEAAKWLKDINKATKLMQLAGNKDPQALAFFEKFKDVMPQELVVALTPHAEAAGRPTSTLRDTLAAAVKMKFKSGEEAFTLMLNEPAFAYTNGKTLEDDVKSLMAADSAALWNAVKHITQIMSTAPKAVLKKAMLDAEGKRTNIVTIAMVVVSNDPNFKFFPKETRKKINAHTYVNDMVAAKWM